MIIEGERGSDFYAELGVLPYEVVYEDMVSEEGFERPSVAFLAISDCPHQGSLCRHHARNANPTR